MRESEEKHTNRAKHRYQGVESRFSILELVNIEGAHVTQHQLGGR